jgi:hypothetical protein
MPEEIVAALARVSGERRDRIEAEARRRRPEPNGDAARLRAAEARLYRSGAVRALLEGYYPAATADGLLRRYGLDRGDRRQSTYIFTRDAWTGAPQPASALAATLAPHPLPPTPQVGGAWAGRAAARLAALDVRIWNAPIYRLVGLPPDRPPVAARFAPAHFFDYRFTGGLLTDEVLEALVRRQGDVEAVLARREEELPLRARLLPTADALASLDARVCAGGIGAVVAMARADDFVIPIQTRSGHVSEGHGLCTTLPKAYHQPTAGAEEEVHLQWTVYRELFEELFGGEEVAPHDRRRRFDWYFDASPALDYFRTHPEAFDLEITAFGLNALGGGYEFAMLLAIHDPGYWATFGPTMARAWEADGLTFLSTKDRARIDALLTDGALAGESLFHLAEGLRRLQTLDPRRVALPPMDRVLG